MPDTKRKNIFVAAHRGWCSKYPDSKKVLGGIEIDPREDDETGAG